METTGKLTSIARSVASGKLMVTFEIDNLAVDDINSLSGLDLDIKAVKHRPRRSLDANAYFHVLVGKIADQLRLSKTYVKNMMIGHYGQQDFMEDGSPIILKTNIQPDKMAEQEYLHCLPCRVSVENDIEVIFYKVFRGSHTYDSKEMSILIEGTVNEAKELGIETIPPDELERMIGRWHAA